MKAVLVLMGCLILTGCVNVSLKRDRGVTKDGYTSYKTTLHAEVVDEPICHGTCKP